MSTTRNAPGKGKKFEEHEIYCKLIFLAHALGNLHEWGHVPSQYECQGIELLLWDIADEIYPEVAAKIGGAS